MTSIARHIAILSATVALAGPGWAEMRYENATGGSALIYGQLNPAYQSFDDGVSSTDTLVDNGHSNSRVGLWL